MSYQTWHEYGFGFNFSVFEAECERIGDPITVENVERLLACNLPLQRDVHEWLNEIRDNNPGYIVTLDDYREFDQDFQLGLSKLFADVIQGTEELPHVYATCDYNNDHYVIFGQGHPWNMTEKEKRITVDEMEIIFRTYLAILKPSTSGLLHVDIDNQSIENGG